MTVEQEGARPPSPAPGVRGGPGTVPDAAPLSQPTVLPRLGGLWLALTYVEIGHLRDDVIDLTERADV